jgi:hypothetical protein
MGFSLWFLDSKSTISNTDVRYVESFIFGQNILQRHNICDSAFIKPYFAVYLPQDRLSDLLSTCRHYPWRSWHCALVECHWQVSCFAEEINCGLVVQQKYILEFGLAEFGLGNCAEREMKFFCLSLSFFFLIDACLPLSWSVLLLVSPFFLFRRTGQLGLICPFSPHS